jgi:hypothetical protein
MISTITFHHASIKQIKNETNKTISMSANNSEFKQNISRLRRRYESKRVNSFKAFQTSLKEINEQEKQLFKSLIDEGKETTNKFFENLFKYDDEEPEKVSITIEEKTN